MCVCVCDSDYDQACFCVCVCVTSASVVTVNMRQPGDPARSLSGFALFQQPGYFWRSSEWHTYRNGSSRVPMVSLNKRPPRASAKRDVTDRRLASRRWQRSRRPLTHQVCLSVSRREQGQLFLPDGLTWPELDSQYYSVLTLGTKPHRCASASFSNETSVFNIKLNFKTLTKLLGETIWIPLKM